MYILPCTMYVIVQSKYMYVCMYHTLAAQLTTCEILSPKSYSVRAASLSTLR
jgi:hypothetical protein